ncbi:Ribokinase [Arthrobacter sp. Bi83]|uniref:ribokinase n=1 Tax=Arthrobacter sp. Bi83 TaxID=2822353 RepID=UPI001DD4A7EB|nr:ribokinase [Arthrobacter sp. Bi83]CAH0125242.1 Ribokinase [Arthrobacter sp. Bi83]
MKKVSTPDIVVVGSVNLDMVATVQSLPKPGETTLARTYAEFPGGKGSNQAIAAARLGSRVAFVGRVGCDEAGRTVREALIVAGVDESHLLVDAASPTGRALVLVDETAENSIVVVSGANATLNPGSVIQAAEAVEEAAVVLAQLEVPLEVVRVAAQRSKGIFVLNPAPARALERELLELVDVMVVNEGEFEVVFGQPVPEDPALLGEALAGRKAPASLVVTLGGRGALIWASGETTQIPAPSVNVVDTTGAGDTFVGALGNALAKGEPLHEAAKWAVCAASLSTQSLGATSGMPTHAAVRELHGKLARVDGQ